MISDPRFTQFALDEMNEEEAKAFHSELLEKGIEEEKITNEIQQIKLVADGVSDEFVKDEKKRASSEVREKILLPANATKKPWWRPSKAMTGSFLGLFVVALIVSRFHTVATSQMENLTDSIFGQASNSTLDELDAPASTIAKRQPIKPTSVAAPKRRSKLNQNLSGSGMRVAEEAAISDLAINPPIPNDQDFNREGYDKIDSNPYTLVKNQPLSTFSVDVDTASYANIRRFFMNGTLPPANSVRIEEMINYFNYSYNLDHTEHPVMVKVDQANSPWTKGRKIVRVALEADSPSNLLDAKKNLVFLLDVSGSMSSAKKLPLLKESIKILVKNLKDTDTVSLVVYAGAAGVVLEPTQARERVKIFQALERLSAGGSTNGGAGIEAAYKLAKRAYVPGGVNRVLLATDGDFNIGNTSRGGVVDLIEKKAKDNIFLTVIGLGMGNYQDGMLEEISNRGNGNYAYIDSLSEANKLFNHDLEKNLTTVAKDVKVQIEFNPGKVQAYRLVGYENRMLAAQDFNDDKKDAGEMGAGHTVTAIYEIVPAGSDIDIPAVDELKYAKKEEKRSAVKYGDELLTVKVRYKKPTESRSTKFSKTLKDGNKTLSSQDEDFRFATAVASFGLKLRGDELVKSMSFESIQSLADESRGKDAYQLRKEFIDFIEYANQKK